VRDEKGQKMSKSKGNVMDPLELVDEYGADALRFTMVAMSGQARDIKLAKQRIEGYRNFGTKLWNASRFCQMHECVVPEGFDPARVKQTVNRWIRGEVVKTTTEVTRALEACAFDDVAGALYRFIWNVFCDWYLELSKPVLNGEDEAAKAETRATTAWVLEVTLKLLHPVMPFITEELWDKLADGGVKRPSLLISAAWALEVTLKLLHPVMPFITEELWDKLAEGGVKRPSLLISAPWPSLPMAWIDGDAEAEIGWLVDLVTEVRQVRAEANVPNSARPPLSLVGAGPATRERLSRHRELILSLARLESVREAEAAPKGAAPFVIGEATGALSIAEFIDVAAEKARLAKEIAALEADAERTRKKLGNPDFVARAPEEVVEENRERLAEAEEAVAKLKAALERLQAVE
ncbi:MAG: class I tRNA ligase family protein, partial [Caulobacteraceae bacterium]